MLPPAMVDNHVETTAPTAPDDNNMQRTSSMRRRKKQKIAVGVGVRVGAGVPCFLALALCVLRAYLSYFCNVLDFYYKSIEASLA